MSSNRWCPRQFLGDGFGWLVRSSLPLKLTDWFGTVHLDASGFLGCAKMLNACVGLKLLRESCGDFQTVSMQWGRCASREKMDQSQGCHKPDEKCLSPQNLPKVFSQQTSVEDGTLKVMLVRDTHLLFAALGSAPFSRSQNGSENYQTQNASDANSMLECSETNHQPNGCFLSLAGMNSRRWFDDFDAIPNQMDCKQVNNKTMRFSMHKIFQIIAQYMDISQVMGVSP